MAGSGANFPAGHDKHAVDARVEYSPALHCYGVGMSGHVTENKVQLITRILLLIFKTAVICFSDDEHAGTSALKCTGSIRVTSIGFNIGRSFR